MTLEKCFNVRMGATRKDDTLPWRLMDEPTPDRPPTGKLIKEELDMMLDPCYDLHGWDRTSWPRNS